MLEERSPARRSLLAVVAAAAVLLLACGAGWLLTRPVTAPVADAELDARSRAANGAAFGDGAATTNAQPARTAGDDTRQAADTAGATPPIALRVVDAARRPVAGASVRIDPNAAEIRFLDMQDAEPLLAAIPPRTSDEHGLVHTQLPRGVAMVTVRKNDAYLQTWVDVAEAITDPIELMVQPDRELVVRTRLADGTVAPHVPVEFAYSWDRNVETKRLDHYMFGRTDGDGELVVRHAQRLWRNTPAAPLLLLQPLVVGAKTAATTVSLDAVRTQVDLECAPHGAIRLTCFARDGQPSSAPVALVLKLHRGDAEPQQVSVPAWPEARPGEWFLHPLALGARWQIDGEPYEPLEAIGPRQQGEVVAVQQRQLRSVGRLRFSLQAPDGSALADELVLVASDERSVRAVRTDRQGSIDVARDPDERSIRVRVAERHLQGELPIPAGAAAMPASIDAGVLRLEAQQLLVQGVVVDAASGAPLEAWLEASTPDEPTTSIATARTAADGTFELWGKASAPVRVEANGHHHLEWAGEFEPGARNVVLRLPPVRLLFLTLLFDADIDDEEIDAHLEPRGTGSSYRSEIGLRHQVLPLPEDGDPTLVVSTAGHSLVRVPSAAWQHGPRGATVTVDLRGRLAMFTVQATRGGEPVKANLRLLAGTAEDREAGWLRANRAFVLTTDRPWRALVQPTDGGTVEVALQRGHNVVEAPAPARVRCSLANGIAELGDLRVTFELLRLRHAEPLLATPDDDPPPAQPTTLDALRDDRRNVTRESMPAGEAPAGQFEIGHRGRYAVFAVVEQGGYEVLLSQSPAEFDVVSFDCDLPIVVPLPAATLTAAREELARKAGPR
ncbi:MAG: hypothetical protein ACK501_08665 [Planctomycetota bacterium]|jgi:hypothetical protein